MRPEVLYPLFAPVESLPGVGPRLAAALQRLGASRVVDLLWHLPSGVIDRRPTRNIGAAQPGAVATLTVTVRRHQPPLKARQPYRVLCADATGELTLVFFHPRVEYLSRVLPVGASRVVSGPVDRFGGTLQMTHPDHILSAGGGSPLPSFEPVYPLTEGLTARVLSKLVDAALRRAPVLDEWQSASSIRRHEWPSWQSALEQLHRPSRPESVLPGAPARARLAFDELLANQLALNLIRVHAHRLGGRSTRSAGRLARQALEVLSFRLTRSQEQALAEIAADMAAPNRMLRLLQGDVGSGKTVVALLAMLNAVEAGAQAALMAPTEILARQHFHVIASLAQAAGVKAVLLTGRDRGREREHALKGLASGAVPIAVGTHALFQRTVHFKDLALAVIDEQHRFGVHQRLDLAAKGPSPDVLVMTATPIPRTLRLSVYGDMDASRLTEKPPGRRPVDTRVLSADRLDEVIAGVRRRLDGGAKVYWVCPLVEESAAIDLAAAEARYDHLRGLFGERVGLVHGRMKGQHKDAVLREFGERSVDLLVATTVIEVGVDVPEATVIVIEHAERFGLAQLHQLRGRVGRGLRPAVCILVYTPPLTEMARSRLAILRETEDGFRIAEEDLRLRGAGELLGTRQSGRPFFRVADPAWHADLLAAARDDARLIVETDPVLQSERGKALRTLLYLFERDAAARYLRSG